MGKNQHSKDRMFITATEWKEEYGGHKKKKESSDRQLPFDCCALSLSTYETPVCTKEGVIFDILQIMPYVKQHRKNPLNGEPLAPKQLIRLNMQKNADGRWHCPVTYKVFTDHTHVVAVRPTGNVYAWDAVKELNLKAKNMTDLLTGEPFARKDLLHLQNPNDPAVAARRNLDNFVHLKEVREEAARRLAAEARSGGAAAHIRRDAMSGAVLDDLAVRRRAEAEERARRAAEEALKPKKVVITTEDLQEGWQMTSGKVSGSFTSSAQNVHTQNITREATEEEIREARWKRIRRLGKKGYAQLQTTHGNLNLEVACDIVPRVAENFLGLVEKGYYDGCPFHRVVRNFMAQTGDPTGTGKGGESFWGEPFRDEFESRMVHSERGVLSMANSGPNTNKSQFFITFKSCRHLDNQHSVFGRVVGGLDALRRIELVETDKKDHPKEEVKIIKAVVFVNPIEEAVKLFEEELAAKRKAREDEQRAKKRSLQEKKTDEDNEDRIGWYSNPTPNANPTKKNKTTSKVGKYIGRSASSTTLHKASGAAASAAADTPAMVLPGADDDLLAIPTSVPQRKKKLPTKTQFGDFSGW